jgi:hypothetical protein
LVAEAFWLWERMFRVRLRGYFPDHLHFPRGLDHFWYRLVPTFLMNIVNSKKLPPFEAAAFF